MLRDGRSSAIVLKRSGEDRRGVDEMGKVNIFSKNDLKIMSRHSLKKTDKFVLQMERSEPSMTKKNTETMVSQSISKQFGCKIKGEKRCNPQNAVD